MKKVFFLNNSLKDRRTGVEEAAFKRTFYFQENLNFQTYFVTIEYNASSKTIFKELQNQGKIHKDTIYVNIYDFFQGFSTKDKYEEINYNEESRGLNVVSVKGKKDRRYLNSFGKIAIYNKRDEKGRTVFNNYFTYSNDKKQLFRREYFDSLTGRVSKVQFLDEDRKVDYEVYYNNAGRPCIYQRYVKSNQKNRLESIEILDSKGLTFKHFNSKDEFIKYWYKEYFEAFLNKELYLIVDRPKTYSRAIDYNRLPHSKIIFMLHSSHLVLGHDVENGRINSNHQYLLNNPDIADAIVVFTERQKSHLEKRFSNLDNIYVIPHSLKELPRKVAFETRIRKKIIYLARFSVAKNHKSLINTFKKVLRYHPDAVLFLYGEGKVKKEVSQLVKKYDLSKSIVICGFTNDVEKVYNESGIAVLPSKLEGFSLFALESISHGLPLISYDIDYGPETIIEHEKSGFLVSKFNEDDFAARILNLLDNDLLHERMSIEAYNRAKEFGVQKIAEKWKEMILKI